MSGYEAAVQTTCPACTRVIVLRTSEVTVGPDGRPVIGHASTDLAVDLHLRVGCDAQ